MEKVLTFLTDVTPLLEQGTYRRIYGTLPEFRRKKADAALFPEDKALSAGAWQLYCKAKETFALPDDSPYNLSHSGCYALVSIAPAGEEVGCDVEMVRASRMKIAERFFCSEEYASIMKQSGERRNEMFYRYWVLKESFIKATRYGMKLGMDSFEISLEAGKDPVLLRQPEFLKRKYYFREFETVLPAARIAVCSTCGEFEKPEIIRLDEEE